MQNPGNDPHESAAFVDYAAQSPPARLSGAAILSGAASISGISLITFIVVRAAKVDAPWAGSRLWYVVAVAALASIITGWCADGRSGALVVEKLVAKFSLTIGLGMASLAAYFIYVDLAGLSLDH